MNSEPRWQAPFPYGYGAAIDSMGSISAPLLAGISVALAALVLSSPHSFHLVNVTLLLLVGATFALVTTVQCTFRARQFVVGPAELESWWPDHDEPRRREMLRREQRYHRREFEKWARVARQAYNAGISFFALGVTTLLVPKRIGHASFGHLAPAVLAVVGFVAELIWIWTSSRVRPVSDWPAAPDPEG